MTEVRSSCQAQVCQLVRYLNCSIGRQGSNGAELRSRRERVHFLREKMRRYSEVVM